MVVKYTKDGAPYRTPPYSAAEREQMSKGLNDTPTVVGRYRWPKTNRNGSHRKSHIPASASSLDGVES